MEGTLSNLKRMDNVKYYLLTNNVIIYIHSFTKQILILNKLLVKLKFTAKIFLFKVVHLYDTWLLKKKIGKVFNNGEKKAVQFFTINT